MASMKNASLVLCAVAAFGLCMEKLSGADSELIRRRYLENTKDCTGPSTFEISLPWTTPSPAA